MKNVIFIISCFLTFSVFAQTRSEKIIGTNEEEVVNNAMNLIEKLPEYEKKEMGKAFYLYMVMFDKVDSAKVYGLRKGYRLDQIEELKNAIFMVDKTLDDILEIVKGEFEKNRQSRIKENEEKIARAQLNIQRAIDDSLKLQNEWKGELEKIKLTDIFISYEGFKPVNGDTVYHEFLNISYKNKSKVFKKASKIFVGFKEFDKNGKKLREYDYLDLKINKKEASVKRIGKTVVEVPKEAKNNILTWKAYEKKTGNSYVLEFKQIHFKDGEKFHLYFKERIDGAKYSMKSYQKSLEKAKSMTWERLIDPYGY
jgi:hypothetical protein